MRVAGWFFHPLYDGKTSARRICTVSTRCLPNRRSSSTAADAAKSAYGRNVCRAEASAVVVAREELPHQCGGSLRVLELRHVTAVPEDDGLRVGHCSDDVPLEGGRHEPVAVAPDEQRRRLKHRQAVPEAAVAVRLFQVDLLETRVERPAVRVIAHHPTVFVGSGVVPL